MCVEPAALPNSPNQEPAEKEYHTHDKAETPPGVSSGMSSAGSKDSGPQCLTCERKDV